MTFSKPKNVTYVDMCKYFEKHIYDEVRDDETLYKYLYHIYYMLACESKYFYRFEDYDNYAIYAANKIYLRIINRKNPDNKIKSILNYAKATKYPLKLEYQNSTFSEVFDKQYKKIDTTGLEYNYKDMIQAQYKDGLSEELVDAIEYLPKIIKKVVSKTPYKKDKLMCHRLYMSCLISLIKNITLTSINKSKLSKKTEAGKISADFLEKIYKVEKDSSITLWNLPESMHDYVYVLINIIKHKFMHEVESIVSSFELPDTLLQDILMSSYSTKENAYYTKEE